MSTKTHLALTVSAIIVAVALIGLAVWEQATCQEWVESPTKRCVRRGAGQ